MRKQFLKALFGAILGVFMAVLPAVAAAPPTITSAPALFLQQLYNSNAGTYGAWPTDANGIPLSDGVSPPPSTYWTETTTALGASATFTGSARTLPTATSARYFYAVVYSDQSSASNGFQIQCYNGTGYVEFQESSTTGGGATTLQAPLICASYKVVFTNGTTAETTLWVQTGFAN
jgi:hypothetical protein